MEPLHLTSSQWIDRHRHGAAVMVEGQRRVKIRDDATGEDAFVEVVVDEPDVRCAVIDGRLDARDEVAAYASRR